MPDTDPDIRMTPLRLRSTEERLVEGVVVPWDEEIVVAGRGERFARGAFTGVDPHEVRFAYEHSEVIGRMVELRDEDHGAVGTFRVSQTTRGDDVLNLAADGLLGLSVGFKPTATRAEGRTEVITAAELREVSAVGFPAYKKAVVTAIRSEEDDMDDQSTTEEATEVSPPAEQHEISGLVDEIVERAADRATDELRSLIVSTRQQATRPEPQRGDWRDLYVRALQAVANPESPYRTRALADVVGDKSTTSTTAPTDAMGLVYDWDYRPEIVSYLDARRPLFAAAGTVGFPDTGYGLLFPRIDQHSQVSKRTKPDGEKTEVASRALQVGIEQFEMDWFAGAVDVSMELIWQSNPAVLGVLVDDMLDQYAIATESEFASDTETVATATGAALDFTDYGTLISAVAAESSNIRKATGIHGNLVALTDASWVSLLTLLDGDNRRILSTIGATNADGSAALTAESVEVAGIRFFHSPYSSADVIFNAKSLRKAEKPPVQVSTDNVALMGRDIGMIGATITVPLYSAGIKKFTA